VKKRVLPDWVVRLFAKGGGGSGYRREYRPSAVAGGERGRSLRTWLGRWLQRRRHRPQRDPLPGSDTSRRFAWFRLVSVILLVLCPLLFVSLGGVDLVVRGLQAVAFFQITEIEVTGNAALSQEELRRGAGVMLHRTSLIGLDPGAIEAKLAANPWVAKVSVRRDFPSTLRITVVENHPVALLHTGDGESDGDLVYLDARGTPFLSLTPGAESDFPVITGLMAIVDPDRRRLALTEALQFLRRAQSNNPHLPAQAVSELHFAADGGMVLYLVDYPFPIFFGNGGAAQKYFRLVEVLKALYKKQDGRELISRVQYIDMEYMQDKVLVAQSDSG
jgi:cell division protein FtsQ